MSYRGRIKNGVVLLDGAIHLPDDSIVEITVLDGSAKSDSADATNGAAGSWLQRAEQLGLIGVSDRGPADLSTNRAHFEGFGRGGQDSR